MSPFRAPARTPLALLGAAAVALIAAIAPAAPAAAACAPVTVWTSVPDVAGDVLLQYDPAGTLLTTVRVAGVTGLSDIAVSHDGEHLWGIGLDSTLREIDRATGAVLSTGTVAGPWPGGSNALSTLPDGRLVTAAMNGGVSQLYAIDPATRTSEAIPGATLPVGYTTSGDVVAVGPQTLLATVITPSGTALYSLDLSTTPATGAIVGTTPLMFGAARVGNAIYLAGSDGTLSRTDGIPSTPSTDPVALTAVASTATSGVPGLGPYWGAASTEDSGLCAAVTPPVTPPASPVPSPTATPAPAVVAAVAGDDPAELAATGSADGWGAGLAALALVAAGGALLVRRRAGARERGAAGGE